MPMMDDGNCKCIRRAVLKIKTKDGVPFNRLDEDDVEVRLGDLCGEIMLAVEEYYYLGLGEFFEPEVILDAPINVEETSYELVASVKARFTAAITKAIESGTVVSVRFPVESCPRDEAVIPIQIDPLTGLTVYRGFKPFRRRPNWC